MRLFPLALVTLVSVSASAQIATDRPGLGFSPAVVDRGVVQVETGLPQATASGGVVQALSLPVALRYGLTDAVELRLGTSVYDLARRPADGGFTLDGGGGFDVLEVGAKVQLVPDDVPLALIASVFVPTTDGGDLEGAVRSVAGFALTDRLSLTAVLGATVSDAEPDLEVAAEAIGVLAASLAGPVSAYVEAGAFPDGDATPILAGAGLLVLVSPDVQLDASFDVGLTESADDVLFGVGASVRL